MKIEEEIQQKAFSSAHQKAVINLIYTSNWLIGTQQKFLSQFGITAQQFNILRILRGQHPGGLSATAIKSTMLDRNSDVSRLLDRMLKRNLVLRKSCQTDKRAMDGFITQGGLDSLSKRSPNSEAIESALALTESEAELLGSRRDRASE